ncbi:MAG: DUF1569 domain-containing protein [Saprospiraceae bacterium]|nr:DUF1569 domain-containing protein [Pyrinomonadaceae bacterium]
MRNLQNKKVYAEIMERLQNIKPESPRLWGKMTAHQMICHLTDAFRGVMGKKHVAPTGTLFQRAVVKRLMLNLPPMPVRNYPTSPEIDQEIGGTTPAEFGADMEKLYSIILDFIRDGDEFRRWSHPFFGSLSRREWSRWAYLHLNHHLKQFGR